jgi:hypothetical protein
LSFTPAETLTFPAGSSVTNAVLASPL